MEGRELPVGWDQATLAELIDRIEAGKNFRCIERPPLNGEIGIVKVSAVSWGRFREEESKTVPPGVALDSETRIHQGDLLFSRANTIELVGACVMVESLSKDLRLSDKILRLVPSEEAVKPWIYRYLSSPQARKYLSETSSGNQLSMRNVSQRVLLETLVPLAPLNEQRRIAAKLDTTIAAVEACRQRLDGVAAILKRFRQAVLAAATSGELTREWASNSLWKEISITDVCEVVRGSSPRPAGDQRYFGSMGTVPWITVGELTKDSDKYLLSTSCFLTDAGMSKSRRIMPGTLLLTNSGVTLGVPKISLIEGCINDGSVALLGLEEPLKSYVYYVLRSKTQYLRSINQGAAQPNLNTSIVKAIRFMVPDSSKEQSEVVRRIEELFTLAGQLEARLNVARKIVDRLTPALLAKAFRGELVSQDPNDEPASVLLERLAATRRAARQAEAGAGKPSRRGRPKAAANPDQLPLDAAPVPPDFLAALLRECGALTERALLAVSELEPERFEQQLFLELERGTAREVQADEQVLLEAVG